MQPSDFRKSWVLELASPQLMKPTDAKTGAVGNFLH